MTNDKILPEPLTQPAKEYRAKRDKYESDFLDKMASDVCCAADYEATIKDHNRLVRELDIALNGKDGAAQQASLCDIVSQVKSGKWQLVKTAVSAGAIKEAVSACRAVIEEDPAWSGEWRDTFEVVFNSALQSPAVPREVVDFLQSISKAGYHSAKFSNARELVKILDEHKDGADKALALLGGKEG